MAQRPTTKVSTCPSLQFTQMNNLSRGSKVLFATDDWFAEAENLLKVRDQLHSKITNLHTKAPLTS